MILLRPSSQAEILGVGVPSSEPWGIPIEKLKSWRPAALMADKIYQGLSERPVQATPSIADFPPIMTDEWRETWGAEISEKLVSELAKEPPLGVRVLRKWGASAVLKDLKAGSKLPVSVQLSDISPLGVRLGGYVPILGSEWYEKGAIEIQDEGSQLMSFFALWPDRYAHLLSDCPGPKAGQTVPSLPALPDKVPPWTVIDACAGAGGKSLALADALEGKGRVYAYDISEKKLQALKRRAKHAGFNNIQAVALPEGQEAEAIKKFRKSANVVLVDAPCSGWGVLRRNPDIKWRQTRDAIDRMPVIQKRLLSLYADLVAPGGRLVFGVCTFRKAETSEVVAHFLEKHPDFRASRGGYLGPGPSDGFFMQAFERRS